MSASKTRLEAYINEEVNKYGSIYRPIRASLLRRLFVKNVACSKIHPNPNDEFSIPEVGPNPEIISRYAEEIRKKQKLERNPQCFDEKVMVERIVPDGYMLLNGHHRWGAAIQMGLPKIRVKIVNLTQMSDIRRMLEKAKNDRRVTMDLDEVVFHTEQGDAVEKPLPFPLSLRYKENMRLGMPALIQYLNAKGYDVWLYSANYYSMEHIRKLFLFRRALVSGIVTGTGRKGRPNEPGKKELEAIIAQKYRQTIHIDNQTMVRVNSRTREYEDYSLSGNSATWVREVKEIMGALESQEK